MSGAQSTSLAMFGKAYQGLTGQFLTLICIKALNMQPLYFYQMKFFSPVTYEVISWLEGR
jgi:hypothetical protein